MTDDKTGNVSLNVPVSIVGIIEATETLDHASAETLILGIDRNMADYEFTLNIIKKLVKSLKDEEAAGHPEPLTAKDIGL